MSQVKQTPTVNPAFRANRDPNYHYVRVEGESDKFDMSQIETYLDPNSEGLRGYHPVYEVVSTNRQDTGNSRMSLLRCPKEEYEKHEAALIADATRNQKPRKDDKDLIYGDVIGAYTEVEVGGVTTRV